ncbi:MAG TPA: 4-alpha-glucanotransferase, partial [Candidatus Dormibacteraeota bacterium]|nr:4-alpha-glucanotransferase [Candidatus Dormibacteraeota bacterium]
FFSKGQNWGFPPLHPERIREQHYDYVRQYLQFQMRHAGMLRIDHVMGLHRLYWIPSGSSATEGAYVRYNAEEFYALLSLESHRHQTLLVGENLGTVPPEVNEAMKRHALRGMYVLQFEQRADPKKALKPPRTQVVASVNTHDTPTFAAHLRGEDIKLVAQLGLFSRTEAARQIKGRFKLVKALSHFLRSRTKKISRLTNREGSLDLLGACLEWLANSQAEFVLVNLEDLWSEIEPQNVPGTSDEVPNWRRKARLTIEEIIRSKPLIFECLRRARNTTR